MRDWLRALLFVSAFSPALLTTAYAKYSQSGLSPPVLQLSIVGVIGTLMPLLILKELKNRGEVFDVTAKKVESNDVLLLAFISSYVVPLVTRLPDMSVGAISLTLLTIFFICFLVTSVPAHPIMRLLKYRFYKVELSDGTVRTVISKRDDLNPAALTSVKRISATLLMDNTNG